MSDYLTIAKQIHSHFPDFCDRVEIDKERIDEDLIEHPAVVLAVGNYISELSFLKSRVKRRCEEASARAWVEVAREATKTGKKLTVADTDRLILLQSGELSEFDLEYDKISEILDKWTALRSALFEKASAMRHLSSMLTQGLFPDVATSGITLRDRNA